MSYNDRQGRDILSKIGSILRRRHRSKKKKKIRMGVILLIHTMGVVEKEKKASVRI